MIPSSACQQWRADQPGSAGEHGDKRHQLHHAVGHDLIAYVRPQVDWLNAGWWQWFAWMDQFSTPDDVTNAWGVRFLCWANLLDIWKTVPGVRRVITRLQTRDIVPDFFAQIGVDFAMPTTLNRKNLAMSMLLAKLYKSLPHMRSVHSSELDAYLSQLLGKGGNAPWVVSRDLARRLIAGLKLDNERLLDLLDEEQREQMRNDQRWWSVDAYEERLQEVQDMQDLNLDEAKVIIEKLLNELVRVRNSRK